MAWGGGPVPMTEEGVFFTELGDYSNPSKRVRLPAGSLNRTSHAAIVAAVRSAVPFTSNVPLKPANVPSPDEFPHAPILDEDDLRWVYREKSIPLFDPSGTHEVEHMAEFLCLDDTALRGSVRLSDGTTLSDMMATHGAPGVVAVIETIKRSFPDIHPLAP